MQASQRLLKTRSDSPVIGSRLDAEGLPDAYPHWASLGAAGPLGKDSAQAFQPHGNNWDAQLRSQKADTGFEGLRFARGRPGAFRIDEKRPTVIDKLAAVLEAGTDGAFSGEGEGPETEGEDSSR